MTLALVLVVVFSAVALGLSAFALWVAISARAEAITARGELARHRRSHADRAEERRAVRHGPTPAGPTTEQLPTAGRHGEPVQLDTAEQEAPTGRFRQPPPPLPRPGAIGRPE